MPLDVIRLGFLFAYVNINIEACDVQLKKKFL